MQKRVVITGTGAVAGAIARALVPAGYDVSTISRGPKGLVVYKNLTPNWNASPENVLSVLNGSIKVDPFFALDTYSVPHTQLNLSEESGLLQTLLSKADTLIMTAANPNSDQTEQSAEINYQIDINTLGAALNTGVKNIIYTSSVWRTVEHSYPEFKQIPINPDSEAPDRNVPYARAKARAVRHLRHLAELHKDKIFSYIDLGWYPRETMGAPISNVSPLYLQWWIAECELQQLYLHLASLEQNSHFKNSIASGQNLFSFNGFSKNNAPNSLAHQTFPYDLSHSTTLGIKHQFNVYDVLMQKSSDWRKIPIPSK